MEQSSMVGRDGLVIAGPPSAETVFNPCTTADAEPQYPVVPAKPFA
jgi:hypothetical protein